MIRNLRFLKDEHPAMVLGSQCAARPGSEHEETDEIAGDDG
jgi:hypothetical protein